MPGPLEGIRVIEVAMWAFVPSAGGVLADWGAEVIKIEAPTGDPIRGLVSSGIGKTDGITYTWENFNRGKRGMVLDLREPTAQKIVRIAVRCHEPAMDDASGVGPGLATDGDDVVTAASGMATSTAVAAALVRAWDNMSCSFPRTRRSPAPSGAPPSSAS